MQIKALLTLFSLVAASFAENTVESDDVPGACLSVCQHTINLSQTCDRQTNGDDSYRRCVCNATDARVRMTECASCVKQNWRGDDDDDDDDDDYNDVADLMDDCGWNFNDNFSSILSSSSVPTTNAAPTITPTSAISATSITTTSSPTTIRPTTTPASRPGTASTVPTAGAPMMTAGVGGIIGAMIMALDAML